MNLSNISTCVELILTEKFGQEAIKQAYLDAGGCGSHALRLAALAVFATNQIAGGEPIPTSWKSMAIDDVIGSMPMPNGGLEAARSPWFVQQQDREKQIQALRAQTDASNDASERAELKDRIIDLRMNRRRTTDGGFESTGAAEQSSRTKRTLSSTEAQDDLESLQAKLAESKDPKERYKLAGALLALRRRKRSGIKHYDV